MILTGFLRRPENHKKYQKDHKKYSKKNPDPGFVVLYITIRTLRAQPKQYILWRHMDPENEETKS